jgi:hypothetical protein
VAQLLVLKLSELCARHSFKLAIIHLYLPTFRLID